MDIFTTLTLIDGDSSIGSLDVWVQSIQTIKDGYFYLRLGIRNVIVRFTLCLQTSAFYRSLEKNELMQAYLVLCLMG